MNLIYLTFLDVKYLWYHVTVKFCIHAIFQPYMQLIMHHEFGCTKLQTVVRNGFH